MSDELLRYYNNELQFLRRQGDEFARSHKELAAHLALNSEGNADPYVGRLVQAFAYLNARTRMKLDDEFPEIAGSILDIVLPHYQRPIPSTSIVQFQLDSSQAEQFTGHPIAAGSTLESEEIEGEPCYFRTCYPVTCWPFRVTEVALRGVPFEAPPCPSLSKPPLGLLKIQLKTLNREIPFSAFQATKLAFFIDLESPFSFQLFELIFDSVRGVGIARSPKDTEGRFFTPKSIRRVGFGVDEGLFDYPPQSFLGYRLISEYFVCREKFLFFEIDMDDSMRRITDSTMELYLYLDRRWQDLEPHVEKNSLKIGCTPIINLFPKRAEPIRLNHFRSEYRIIPDSRRPKAHEVYSVQAVRGVSSSGQTREFQPFYSVRHCGVGKARAFWHSTRRELLSDDALARGTEVDIAFVDADFDPLVAEHWTIDIDTLCSNRNLPSRMPFGGGRPRLHLEGSGAVASVTCLKKLSLPKRPVFGQGLRWRAVSHLSLNHLSLVDSRGDMQGAMALRELLTLYDFGSDPTAESSIAGITHVASRPVVGRVPGDRSGALCRGISITVDFDEDKYTSGNLFLFACVLEQFFALYSNINSFTQMLATSNRRQGVMHQWPARAGLQEIL
jgi:type VI secretion system protein ImpG